tara:strand:- start:500 stop:1276 length:777 start_codon:yes stop_codon:yes gene_type:complete
MIICELGLNHKGVEPFAKQMVEQLIETNCDAITFQERESDFYKNEFESFRLPDDFYDEIINGDFRYRHHNGNDKLFGVALANHDRINDWIEFGVNFFKVLSWDLTNYSYIDKLIETGRGVYVSTGLATDNDIKNLSKRYGYSDSIYLVHTQLSQEVRDCNLSAIREMNKQGFKVGYGNHCSNLNTIYTSVAYNPSDYWFYVKSIDGVPDDEHAVMIKDVNEVVKNIDELETSLGFGMKENNAKPFNKGVKSEIDSSGE